MIVFFFTQLVLYFAFYVSFLNPLYWVERESVSQFETILLLIFHFHMIPY